MPKPTREICIVQKRYIDQMDYEKISVLQTLCESTDHIALKLELEYKLADAQSRQHDENDRNVNEFMYYIAGQLIGYLGICGFAGETGPLELTGMVHPQHRGKGIFHALSGLAAAECRRRNAALVLGLCDRKAETGQALMKKQSAALHHSECEMILQQNAAAPALAQLRGVTLRKARNADAKEITRQDRLYFADEDDREEHGERKLLPEEEEKRGFTIYLAMKEERIIGKVNLQLNQGVGGIYGLGVLPKERGKGYGRAVLLLAVQKLLESHAETVFLQVMTDNERALSLYKSCGFETSSVMDYFVL